MDSKNDKNRQFQLNNMVELDKNDLTEQLKNTDNK